jgi:hypothetical protein
MWRVLCADTVGAVVFSALGGYGNGASPPVYLCFSFGMAGGGLDRDPQQDIRCANDTLCFGVGGSREYVGLVGASIKACWQYRMRSLP